MKELAIAILASRRPRYMYVTLDGIFRMRNIENADVYICVDGFGDRPVPKFFQDLTLDYARCFPVKEIIFHHRLLGLLYSHMEAWRLIFSKGYEWVLYIDDDLLLRSDALIFLENSRNEYNGFFYNLFNESLDKITKSEHEKISKLDGWECGVHQVCGFGPWGLMINRDNFQELDRDVRNKVYLDLPWGDKKTLMRDIPNIEIINDDGIFRALAHFRGWKRVSPIQSRLAHFGVVNSNIVLLDEKSGRISRYRDSGYYPTVREDLETRMFAGPKEKWIDNIDFIFRSDQLKDMPYASMVPFYFEYS